jgi:ammonia channel protein AmtB
MAGTDLMGLVELTPLAKAINALNAAADVLIAAVMVYLLRQGRTGIGASDNMINQLASYSLSISIHCGLHTHSLNRCFSS